MQLEVMTEHILCFTDAYWCSFLPFLLCMGLLEDNNYIFSEVSSLVVRSFGILEFFLSGSLSLE